MKWVVDQTTEPSLVTTYNGFNLKMVSRPVGGAYCYIVFIIGTKQEVARAFKKGDLYRMIRDRLGGV